MPARVRPGRAQANTATMAGLMTGVSTARGTTSADMGSQGNKNAPECQDNTPQEDYRGVGRNPNDTTNKADTAVVVHAGPAEFGRQADRNRGMTG